MMLPRWLSVYELYCLTKSMMFTPCGPSAVPTGGAGVAWPAGSCTLTTADSLFLLGGMGLVPHLDLGYLVERQLDGRLAAEDRHQHLELLGVRVDLVHRGGQGGERPVHHGKRLADLEVRGGRAWTCAPPRPASRWARAPAPAGRPPRSAAAARGGWTGRRNRSRRGCCAP